MSDTPIDDCLDELLRRTRADARTARRLLDEANEHLQLAAAELETGGMSRVAAEREAVARFGSLAPIVRASARRSLVRLVLETLRAAIYLASCGLVAVGISGLVALVMNLWFGRSFVGGFDLLSHAGPIDEAADDAVILRVIAGVAGLVVLLGSAVVRRRAANPRLLPAGLVDALGAAAFAAGTVGLAIASVDEAVQHGPRGVGFPLSGALVALPACVYFCVRAARAMLPTSDI